MRFAVSSSATSDQLRLQEVKKQTPNAEWKLSYPPLFFSVTTGDHAAFLTPNIRHQEA
jgi:hypothetical protein